MFSITGKAAAIFCGLILFLNNTCFSQKENNIWYFGTNAGITFNGGSPVALTNSAMNTNEGCTSVSDANGNLLFYSDGRTVWNRNHLPMPNGTGLLGHYSATQSVLTVPKPGSPNIYFLFTVDAIENNLQNGLRYSVLDMNLAGGMGAITTTKNVLLETPVTEKLTAVRHSNGVDFWVLIHKWNNNGFSAYLVSSAGVSVTPVATYSGSIHGGSTGNAIGQLKSNKKGTRLALAIRDSNKFELFDFNASTGVVSNPISSSAIYSVAAGVEFSADDSKLYASAAYLNAIYQFDMNAANPFNTGIQIASNLTIPTNLQIGPDDKIYTTERDGFYLGVIHNPNAAGAACNFVRNGVYLAGRKVWFGLPNFIPGVPRQDFTFSGLCAGNRTTFTITNNQPSNVLSWNFGDPNTGAQNTSTLPNPVHTFSGPGTYLVTLTVSSSISSQVVSKNVVIYPSPEVNLGNDTSLCEGQTLLLGRPPVPGLSYKWQDGSVNSTYLVTTSGTYFLEVSQGSCKTVDTLKVTYSTPAGIDLGPDRNACEGEAVVIGKEPVPGFRYLWQDGSTNSTFRVTKAGTYKLQVFKDNCPMVQDEVRVTFRDCSLFIPNIITPNQDGLNDAFKIRGLEIEDHGLRIFNRWGVLVYETDSYQNDWDAKNAAAGVYYFLLKHKQLDKTYKGWLEVVK